MNREFLAELEIIDGNPFVFVPEDILEEVFSQAGWSKGPIPIRGVLNERPFQQTLVRFRGAWRLYVNMQMLTDSPRRIGECITVSIAYDPSDRTINPHPKWVAALKGDEEAQRVFDGLSPSRRKEIVRYIAGLKTEESVERNVRRALDFLHGNGRFVGREAPREGE